VKTIYKEGVYPAQGARPIFTTIHQLIKSKLGIYINELLMRRLNADTLSLTVINGKLKCMFFKKNKELFSYSESLPSDLEKLRAPKKDEIQAITAVHEAGHAVLSMVLFDRVPEVVVSVTSVPNSEGFIYTRNNRKYLSKKDLIPKTAVYLGGIVAEELIFGAEHITAGSSSDIEGATGMLSVMLKKEGMHELPVSYAFSSVEESAGIHESTAIEERVKELIYEARELARATLLHEKQLLLAISEQLAVRSKLEKKEVIELRTEHMKGGLATATKADHYRKMLRNSIEEQQQNASISEAVLLNKNHGKNKAS
jgi:cell division protease FtsH